MPPSEVPKSPTTASKRWAAVAAGCKILHLLQSARRMVGAGHFECRIEQALLFAEINCGKTVFLLADRLSSL